MTRTVRLPIAVATLACIPLAAIAQPVDTPGVTSPLTAAQIARENPPNVLTAAAVDKPVVLKSAISVRVVKVAEGLSHPDGLVFLPDGHTMVTTADRAIEHRIVQLEVVPVAKHDVRDRRNRAGEKGHAG